MKYPFGYFFLRKENKRKRGNIPLASLSALCILFISFREEAWEIGFLSVEDTVQKFPNLACPLCWGRTMGSGGCSSLRSLTLLNWINFPQLDFKCDLRTECCKSPGRVNFPAWPLLTHFHRSPLSGRAQACFPSRVRFRSSGAGPGSVSHPAQPPWLSDCLG